MAFTGSRTGNEASCLLKMTPSEMEHVTDRWAYLGKASFSLLLLLSLQTLSILP